MTLEKKTIESSSNKKAQESVFMPLQSIDPNKSITLTNEVYKNSSEESRRKNSLLQR